MRKPLEEFHYAESVVMSIVQQNRHSLKYRVQYLNVEQCISKFVRKTIKHSDCRTIKVRAMHSNPIYWRVRIFERNKPIERYTYEQYIQENG